MKVLVFGETGQVATELQRRCPREISARFLGREKADLSDPEACAKILSESSADAVINAAAYTAVDRAEEQEPLASAINGACPGAMAQAAAEKAVPFLHISTDYVFDGTGAKAWQPGDRVAPLGAYGRSKLAGEDAIRAAGGQFAILRTSWVFSAHGGNFVKTMLRLSETRDQLEIVADQVGGPTPAAAIADALWDMAQQMRAGRPGGVFHFAGAPEVSWAEFAREIFAQAGRKVLVRDIKTQDYPTPAKRPLNSRLDCSDLARMYNIERPDWTQGLAAVIQELTEGPA